ncbi:hypothetical protein PF011_g327 [Phytophthora fragariae]|uniref:Uncharacterized protein n=2 Tax=Phytophthora TaxID=4783 RepID=A0A6A3MP27_9STRA|nr:hypothetical protein PF011_g327 [Phytophthora fragariae]KAE9359250.1 hypothetical protein PF008_g2330 [Phytophthora fragariae]
MMSRAATSRQVFRAQLVMEDATGGKTRLKHSKRHGALELDASTQSAQLVYPRVGRFFQRKFEQPLKCVMGRKLLRVYSSNGKRSFTCRLLSEEDAVKCSETFQSFGVEVIGVGGAMLSTIGVSAGQDAAVMAGGEAALQAVREASRASIEADIRDYEESSQLRADTEAVVRAMFNVAP